jgi:hypothetical protein
MHSLKKPGRAVGRIISATVFIVMLAVAANAYTIVMRGGRRIEIPSHFVVTASTLTYEVGPGIQITLQMAAVDIPATEKANNESPGSLLRRGQSSLREPSDPTLNPGKAITQTTRAVRTVTNRDLETSVRRRRNSELAYERKRKELGLPSVEESRRQAALESESIGMELEQKRLAESEAENYWRGRAAALRTELAALDAELAYVRGKIDEGPFAMSNGWSNGWSGGWSGAFIIGGLPFGSFGRRGIGNSGARGVFPPMRQRSPNIFVAPDAPAQIRGRVAFGGGATRGQVFINPGTVYPARPHGIRGPFPPYLGWGRGWSSGWSSPNYDLSYERSALITRFNELGAARAGLNARWRELEDEARRAGAPPGWLRP